MFALSVRGYHPLRPCFPDRFRLSHIHDWPGPRSLATTSGVSVDVLSSRYLDVSVPWVRFETPMDSGSQYSLVTIVSPKRAIPSRYPRPGPPWNNNCRKWVSPFGNLRIKACSQLPEAY